jgi:hypothetical protein
MKTIDWNKASELGLIQRINKEILHPLGLAMTRNPETGISENLLIADDGLWEYSPEITLKPILTNTEIQNLIKDIKP